MPEAPNMASMPDRKILIISGTNRPQSHAIRIARVLEAQYAASSIPAEVFSLAELPPEMFDPSAYAVKPPAMAAIQQRVLAASGLHVITPEYNGSFPGVLKYFIDMLKFPESFNRKPVAFIGEAKGTWGGLRSVEQLIQIFGYRNAHIFPDRVFIPGVDAKFNGGETLLDDAIAQRLKIQAAGFSQFISHVSTSG
jgi:NAD(P)H-dependent FMN reductase